MKQADEIIIGLLKGIKAGGGGGGGGSSAVIASDPITGLALVGGSGRTLSAPQSLFLIAPNVEAGGPTEGTYNGNLYLKNLAVLYVGQTIANHQALPATITTTPTLWIANFSGSSRATLLLDSYETSKTGNAIIFRKSNAAAGMSGAQAAITNNTGLGSLNFQGKFDTSTNFSDGAALVVTTAEAWSGTNRGASLDISTVKVGQAVLSSRLSFDGAGKAFFNNGALSVDSGGTGVTGSATTKMAVRVALENVSVPIGGANTDIGTIAIPAGVGRYRMVSSVATASPNTIVTESAGPTSATFALYELAAAGGQQLLQPTLASGSANGAVGWPVVALTVTSATPVFVRQVAAATVAGVVSFYIWIMPL